MGNKYHRENGKIYYSEALMVCHKSAQDLFEMGVIDADEMREYDEGCLVQESKTVKTAEKSPVLEHATA